MGGRSGGGEGPIQPFEGVRLWRIGALVRMRAVTPRGPYENARASRALPWWRVALTVLLLAPVLSCGDDDQIVVPVDPDAVAWTRVTDPAQVHDPYYPDWRGDSILFEYVSSVGPIWLGSCKADGSNPVLYSEPGPVSDIFPRFLTDDIAIFSSNRVGGGNYDIWYRTLSTGAYRRLTRFPEREFAPAPRPGRPSVAYAEGTEPLKGRIVLLADTVATSLVRTYLTPTTMLAGEPDWSPDGNKLCFSSEEADGSRHIWLAALNDTIVTELRQLTTGAIYDLTPRFSPDGTRIAFTSNRSARPGVWWVSVDGEASGMGLVSFEDSSDPAGPPGEPIQVFSPCWSPDGTQILVSSNARGDRAIWRLSNLPF